MRQAAAGDLGPLWVMAKRQTAGRGRMGRQWRSEPGNLHASLLLTLAGKPTLGPQLSLLAGICVYDTIVQLAVRSGCGVKLPLGSAGLRLKWPNDCLLGNAKLSGILGEAMVLGPQQSGTISLVTVTGIGLNLVTAPKLPDRPVTCLKDHGINADPERALTCLAQEFSRWLEIWQDGADFKSVLDGWKERSFAIGEKLSIKINGRAAQRMGVVPATQSGRENRHSVYEIFGRYAGLDATGALLLDTETDGLLSFAFGDVSLS